MYQSNRNRQSRCLNCFKPLHHQLSLMKTLFASEDNLCGACRSRLIPLFKTIQVNDLEVYACYMYTAEVGRWMTQIKEAQDKTLASVFVYPHVLQLRKRFHKSVWVMVPSSTEKTQERGFHALSEMLRPLNVVLHDLFEKDNIKQRKSHLSQRVQVASHIRLKDAMGQYESVVLVDDVCTTGSSLKACVDLIRPHTVSLEICVLCLHSSWLEIK